MLVPTIARYNAINTMHNSAFTMMQTSSAMIGNINRMNTFGGEHDLKMLNEIDKKYSLDLLTNSLLYKIAYLQDKQVQKKKLNLMA